MSYHELKVFLILVGGLIGSVLALVAAIKLGLGFFAGLILIPVPCAIAGTVVNVLDKRQEVMG